MPITTAYLMQQSKPSSLNSSKVSITMADFVPALTHQIKWSVGENRFDTEGKQPKQLSLFVTKQSIRELASYLTKLAGETDRIKPGKVWDFAKKEEVEVEGFYLNGKGQTGQYGDFGSINLQQIPSKTNVDF